MISRLGFYGFLATALMPFMASASPLLRCQLNQGGKVQILDFAPVQDPYGVKPVDLDGRFRFKAVVIGDAQKIDYIKLYAYYQAKRQPVLLHQATYQAPEAKAGQDPFALTGLNALYSPSLGRELQYGCALIEVAP